MDAGVLVQEVLVDAVVDDVPLITAGNLEHAVVGGAVDAVLGLLTDDQIVLRVDADGAEGRLRGAVADVVVGRAGVVDAPHEVIGALAIEDVGALAEGPRLQVAALGCHVGDGLLLHREHVVVELGTGHEAIAPVEVVLARLGVFEHVDIDGLSATSLLGTVGIGDDGCTTIHEGACGTVAHGYANLLAVRLGVMGGEVEIVFDL